MFEKPDHRATLSILIQRPCYSLWKYPPIDFNFHRRQEPDRPCPVKLALLAPVQVKTMPRLRIKQLICQSDAPKRPDFPRNTGEDQPETGRQAGYFVFALADLEVGRGRRAPPGHAATRWTKPEFLLLILFGSSDADSRCNRWTTSATNSSDECDGSLFLPGIRSLQFVLKIAVICIKYHPDVT
jgi:hypothetical protein